MKKFLKTLKYVLATVTILHGLAMVIMLMAPREDIVKIAEYRIYPPFVGTSIDRVYEKERVYEKQPDNYVAELRVEYEKSICIFIFVNVFIMGVLFLIAFGVTSSYADKKY